MSAVPPSPPVVAIVGAGCSGTLVASQLLRQARRPLSIVLVERSPRFGPGLAYGTADPGHLLNVSAGAMSAWPDDPSHLLRWLDLNSDSLDGDRPDRLDAGSFLPRRLYGLYLQSVLAGAESQALSMVRLRRLQAEVVDVEPLPDGGGLLRCQSGESLRADRVVLAWGNSPLPPAASPGLDRHGWDPAATAQLAPEGSVLLLGTGLTMVDQVVTLIQQGHQGPILALSRRGLRPLAHKPASPIGPWLDPAAAPRTALGLWRCVRRRVEQARQASADWRPVIDGLRPVSSQLWQGLNLTEQRRVLRHAAVVWDGHRHRIAPGLHGLLTDLQRAGQLRVIAGHLLAASPHQERLAVEIRPRGSRDGQRLLVDRLIRCTGLPTATMALSQSLPHQLQCRGLLRPDPLGLGLDSAADGTLIGAGGEALPWLFTLGPSRRGQLWESIAVPELREQAMDLARLVLRSLPAHPQTLPPQPQPSPSQGAVDSAPTEPALLLRQLVDRDTGTFTYLLADPLSAEAALVDPVLEQVERDLRLLRELGLQLRFCLETHLHADHITGAGQLRRRTGCRLIVPEAPGLCNADQLLRGGEILRLGGLRIAVIATPGHTPEHVAYRLGDSHLFSGDALLVRGCGRTDFQNGDAGVLYDSLQRLLELPDGMVVWPGHDSKGQGQSTIGEERRHNPRLAGRTRDDFIALMAHLRLAPPRRIATAIPANRHLGDWLPAGGEPSERERLQGAMNAAMATEAANREIYNDFIGMYI